MITHKGILVILDGLGDRPTPDLGGRTPLEAAVTPHMDRVAAAGLCGLMHPLTPWVPVGTQTGTGLLMGLARADVRRMTRGPVEAAGVGLPLREGDVALRCNFVTFRPNGDGFDILDRRAGRIKVGTEALAAAVDALDLGDGVTAHVRAATQHRAVLVLSGNGLSDAILDTDPGSGRQEEGLHWCTPRHPGDESAAFTARAVNTFVSRSHDILKEHPVNRERAAAGLPTANGIVTRGAGTLFEPRNLLRHLGLQVAVVSGESTLLGQGRLFGFEVIHDAAFTADHTTDLDAKVRATRDALSRNDLVYLHIKGTDTCAHDFQPREKRAFLERIDTALAPLFTADVAIGITGDHSTVSAIGAHTGDPVPACLSAPGIRRDGVTTFGETPCMQGGLGHLSATDFLCALLDHMGRMNNFQAYEHVYFL